MFWNKLKIQIRKKKIIFGCFHNFYTILINILKKENKQETQLVAKYLGLLRNLETRNKNVLSK